MDLAVRLGETTACRNVGTLPLQGGRACAQIALQVTLQATLQVMSAQGPPRPALPLQSLRSDVADLGWVWVWVDIMQYMAHYVTRRVQN